MSGNDKKEHFKSGLRLFVVIAASILFFFAVYRFDAVVGAFSTVLTVLKPIIFGMVIAYLLNPLVDIFAKKLYPKLFKRELTARKKAAINALSVFSAIIIFCLILLGVVLLIIPSIADSIGKLSSVVPQKVTYLIDKGNDFLTKNNAAKTLYNEIANYIEKWIKSDLSGVVYKSADYIFFGVLGVVNFFKNFAIGLLISIYILYNKRSFGNKSRKILCAFFKRKTVDNILFVLKKSNSVFSGFIYGKIVDSLIIGALCLIGISIMGMPYKLLIATVICVTNIIPVFGPYIGGIPCAALILLTDPVKGIYFIVFLILLQTLDGNVIGPKILGETTGIDTFWVMFAIIVGGGLFGVLGMLLGVPVFAVIYYFVSMLINHMLNNKQLPTDSEEYVMDGFQIADTDGEATEDEKA